MEFAKGVLKRYISDFEFTSKQDSCTREDKRTMLKTLIRTNLIALSAMLIACTPGTVPLDTCEHCIDSLQSLSIEQLKQRPYGSSLEWVQSNEHGHFLAYRSDGLRLYSRLALPTAPAPSEGYPVVVYAHGWLGLKAAPNYQFGTEDNSLSKNTIDQMQAAGFAVLVPGYRGHGTLKGIPAEGIESMAAWDNSTYLSPSFYAIDTLNLIDSLDSLQQLSWPNSAQAPKFNLESLHIIGHSQGGDVALTALAISGEGSQVKHAIQSGALISGCFPDRFTQVQSFSPMQKSVQAFMSGDGTWTGSAKGKNGVHNPHFVFPYPSDSIGTLDTRSPEWTWQAEVWSQPSAKEAVLNKYREMYSLFNKQVRDLAKLEMKVTSKEHEALRLQHEALFSSQLSKVGAYNAERYLTEPLAFHYSDRDFYSFPEWNKDLSERINREGGQAHHFPYPGNTHALQLSPHAWFSPEGSEAGLTQANHRNIELFMGRKPQ